MRTKSERTVQRLLQRPIDQMLRKASSRLSLHMPGAQGHAPFDSFDPYLLDTTELSVTDDLYRPSAGIVEAQALAAKSAGAAHTIFLHGGSTAGMHAMLLYAAQQGDTVLLPRNVHISALHLCALRGIVPAFVQPSYTPKGRPYATVDHYLRAMEAHPQAKAVLAVRPDYYGIQCDFKKIAEAAHARGMLMLCDEAHGAHFNWSPYAMNAGRCGADLFIQSAHKTLPALTAGAWLHASPTVDSERLLRLLRMVQTSSPSFVNMLSLDDARAWMDENGAMACDRLAQAVSDFHQKAARLGYSNGQEDFPAFLGKDPLRLVLDAPQGGFRLGEQLQEVGIDVEMCDDSGVVCILSLMDGAERLDRLYAALEALNRSEQKSPLTNPAPPGIPPRIMPLSTAVFAPSEYVAPAQALGRISACQVGLYPPGVALLTAGEQITEEILCYLSSVPKDSLFGLNADGCLNCVINKGAAT
ncbi:MAG: aminotransferase class I/II-fold pyridoxal phosphate-dependent enzyme [Eubacteriales bacterium]|nr:aminotransferase class I/II-fold pyridoxal phosphate-dependent enzyme [Eubacteriales bacterium]